MKLIQSSNIHLGKSFANLGTAGDKLRAAIKATFVKIFDLALQEKVDMVILAGDTFDSPDISQNMLEYFLSQAKRLGEIPLVVLPGRQDPFQKGNFWDEWETLRPLSNLFILANTEKTYIEFESLSTTVYGYPIQADSAQESRPIRLKKFGRSQRHISVIYGTLVHDGKRGAVKYPIHSDEIKKWSFDYTALGGASEYLDLSPFGITGAYSGSPETLSSETNISGCIALVELHDGMTTVKPLRIGEINWKEIHISMEEVPNLEDLKLKISGYSGPNVLLKVTLEGLALLEAGLDAERLKNELGNGFLHLDIVDRTRVLPENVSAVKVQERTMLGQYLKVMVEKLHDAHGPHRVDLDESLKLGYTLLTGKEIR
jgi:DNA repair exonuclease SbcCD nuclease subunit